MVCRNRFGGVCRCLQIEYAESFAEIKQVLCIMQILRDWASWIFETEKNIFF